MKQALPQNQELNDPKTPKGRRASLSEFNMTKYLLVQRINCRINEAENLLNITSFLLWTAADHRRINWILFRFPLACNKLYTNQLHLEREQNDPEVAMCYYTKQASWEKNNSRRLNHTYQEQWPSSWSQFSPPFFPEYLSPHFSHLETFQLGLW